MLSAPFMTIQEVADLLKVSNPTVRSWIKNKELRAVKLEREFRIAKIDLQRFIDLRVTTAIDEQPFENHKAV
jgi:excisionase family DNA binding protein